MKLSVNDVKKLIPHRWPFLLISSFVVIDEFKIVNGKKFGKLWWLACKIGHFSKYPIIPGIVFIELCAQLCAVHAIARDTKLSGNLTIFRGGKTNFKKPFRPLVDIANIQCTFRCEKLGIFFYDCKVFDNFGETYAEIEIKGLSATKEQFESMLNTAT